MSHHRFENGVARGWRRQAFFASRAFFSREIGEGESTVQSGKSDKPHERDFFPWTYLPGDAQLETRCPEENVLTS